MIDGTKLTGFHLDVLKEVGNIGIGNAVTAFAQMLDKKVGIEVPNICLLSLEEFFQRAGSLEDQVSCCNLKFVGDVTGNILFLFDKSSTFLLVDLLLSLEKGTTQELDEMGMSVVKEVSNILAGSYLNAIGSMTKMVLTNSVPIFAFDMLGAVLSSSLVASGYYEDQVLLIETKLFETEDEVKGYFYLLPEPGTLEKIFDALGIGR